MPRVFITGSSTGLGLMAGQLLAEEGHQVVLHARNRARAEDARQAMPRVEAVVTGDLTEIAGMRRVADQAAGLGRFDAIIHNAGVGYREPQRIVTADGLSHVFAVNVLAPYVLTAMLEKPDRLVYLSSGMHRGATACLEDPVWEKRRWNGADAYAESKLYDAMIAFAVARRWPSTLSNALEPGWVPTRMGGPGARDDLNQGYRTQAWLAVSEAASARVSGRYFYHMRQIDPNPGAMNEGLQEQILDICFQYSGIVLSD